MLNRKKKNKKHSDKSMNNSEMFNFSKHAPFSQLLMNLVFILQVRLVVKERRNVDPIWNFIKTWLDLKMKVKKNFRKKEIYRIYSWRLQHNVLFLVVMTEQR